MKTALCLALYLILTGANASQAATGGTLPKARIIKPKGATLPTFGIADVSKPSQLRPGVKIQMRPRPGQSTATTPTSAEFSITEPVDNMIQLSQTKLNSGVAQVAAGITQLSEAAQEKMASGGEAPAGEQLAEGLSVLASGAQDISTARQIESHANQILAQEAQTGTVASMVPELSIELTEESIDPATDKLLKKMENVAKVDADKLISAVNEGESVYSLAAGASGLKMAGAELETAAQLTVEKMGKPTDPKLSEDLTLSALNKDLEIFFKKSASTAASETTNTVSAAVPVAKRPETAPAEAPTAAHSEAAMLEREFYREKSVFEMVRRQLKRRHHEFPRAPL